jgi:hypothetical protein
LDEQYRPWRHEAVAVLVLAAIGLPILAGCFLALQTSTFGSVLLRVGATGGPGKGVGRSGDAT